MSKILLTIGMWGFPIGIGMAIVGMVITYLIGGTAFIAPWVGKRVAGIVRVFSGITMIGYGLGLLSIASCAAGLIP